MPMALMTLVPLVLRATAMVLLPMVPGAVGAVMATVVVSGDDVGGAKPDADTTVSPARPVIAPAGPVVASPSPRIGIPAAVDHGVGIAVGGLTGIVAATGVDVVTVGRLHRAAAGQYQCAKGKQQNR